MAGLGTHSLGDFELGFDVQQKAAAPVNFMPRAVTLNHETGSHELDANGNYVEQHPIDHEVQMRIAVTAGKMASTPQIGHTLDRIKVIQPGGRHEVEVAQRLLDAVAPMVERGAIRVDPIRVLVPVKGRDESVFEYLNLATNEVGHVPV